MANITYKGNAIEHKSISGIYKISSLDISSIQKVTIELPDYGEYRLLFSSNYEDVIIHDDGIVYNFAIYGTPTIENSIIKIDLYSVLRKRLESKIDIIIRKEDYNPILAVKEILEEIAVDYDTYSFSQAFQLRLENNVKMEIVFIPSLMDMRYIDFLQEILNRVGCVIVFDNVNNRLKLIDYFVDRKQQIFNDIFDISLIESKTIKYSLSNDYYNKFIIGIFPVLTARDVFDYEYEVITYDVLGVQKKAFFHESLLTVVSIIENTGTSLKYDRIIDGSYFSSGSLGRLTGVRRNFSVGLEQETIQKKQKSLAENDNVEKVWNDTRNNNNSGVLKITSIAGAFWVGNRVIGTLYTKRNVINFEYPENNNFDVGDYVIFNNYRCIIKSKSKKSDFLRYDYEIEEVLI